MKTPNKLSISFLIIISILETISIIHSLITGNTSLFGCYMAAALLTDITLALNIILLKRREK